ncbi:MAG: hypothetical protein KGH76_06750, partial [Thaumarchaeota archaeon]|nr:hypothetical protein [Nitrososphaerota archaeon]
MKTLQLSIMIIFFLVISCTNLVFAQTSSSISGKIPLSNETHHLIVKSCVRINDLSNVDPQVMQFVRQNNPNVKVTKDNMDNLFWDSLYKGYITKVPEFKSIGGKNETIDIQIGGTAALSCPPIQGGNATFQVNGNQLTYQMGFYSDSSSFYYHTIHFLHANQTHVSNIGNYSTPRYGPLGPITTIQLESPLKQFRHGTLAKDVTCWQGLQLILKAEDGSPACVKLESSFKLMQWGWAKTISENKYQSKYRFDAYPTTDYQNNLLGIQNRTYDFTILNDTMTSYHNPPLQITFHGIVFTLLPSPWYGGPIGSCGGYELRADAKFDDGSHEQIGTLVQGQPCSDNYTQTNLSIHTNPQVGVSVLHQSVRLLVSSATQTAVQFLHLSLSTNSSYIQYGHAIGIDISLNNTSSDTVTIGAASNPPRDDLNTGPCDNVPFGIAILQGFYTQDNMTDAASIPLFPTVPCPFVPSL